MTSVSNVATGTVLWQADTMDEFGHLTSESFGNGVTTTRHYDAVRGTLMSLQSTSGGSSIQDWNYDYDAIGNMKFRADNVVGYTENFTYDNLNRLLTVKDAGFTLQKEYRYDAIGNITYKSDVGFYGYDPNHPHAVTTAGNNTYAYDANGNQISGAGRSFNWTSFNKPQGISTTNGYTGFGYDANHNRISKTTPTSETHYIGKIFERTTMNGISKDISHVYAGSKIIASITDVAGLNSINYMHGDHLGSISVITDKWGAVVERLRFDVFGLPVDPNTGAAKTNIGANNTSRGYTGHEMDASTGLINMNARLYDPVLGRFISADTIVPDAGNMQGYNRYSYVINNPLMFTDPTGHSWWTNFRDTVLKPVVIIAVAIAVANFAPPLGAYVASTLGATGVAATVISGAVVGASAGFAAGAIGAALYGGSPGQILSAGLKGAGAGAITGAVAGYYGGFGGDWSWQRVGATSIAGGFASKSSGGSFNQGFKIALVTSMVRVAWEHTKSVTNTLKDRTGNSGIDRVTGKHNTVGSRGVKPGDVGSQSILKGMGMDPEGQYEIRSFYGRFRNWVSKPHDFMNSGGYNWETGFVRSSQGVFWDSMYDVWSFAGMLPATAFTGIAMTSGFSVSTYDAITGRY